MKICKGFASIITLLILGIFPLPAQSDAEGVRLAMGNPGPYTLVERSDLSRYDNGRYTGHVYREVRASILPVPGGVLANREEGWVYRGNFFVLEETLRDMRQSARGLDAVIPVDFSVYRDGSLRIGEDRGFPIFRGFPAFPGEAVQPGSRWTARGNRAVDPLNQGRPVIVPLIAEYEYQGVEEYRGIPVHRITARYAARYRASGSFTQTRSAWGAASTSSIEGDFETLEGSHTVDILLRAADGLPLMMRDNLDETYTWPGGPTVRFRGFTLTFGDPLIPLNRETTLASLGNSLGLSPGIGAGGGAEAATGLTPGGQPEAVPGTTPGGQPEAASGGQNGSRPGGGVGAAQAAILENAPGIMSAGLDLTPVPEGIRLTLKDLQFAPDSDQLLPEERGRLDLIAQALKEIPDRTFLVEGHTAAVGRPEGELELSLQRARRITDELTRRGIPAERFIYQGAGGTKPLGDNSNEDGRRRNRRVEITILE
jgi:outer membrane protein OmpA-like peptidoglycan-associated protein